MPSAKLKGKVRKIKLKRNFNKEFKPASQSLVNQIEQEHKQDDLFLDLLDEISTIKTRRGIEFFVRENRDIINGLNGDNRNKVLTEIQNFFN